MERFNTLIIDREKFGDDFHEVIGKLMDILTRAGYVMVFGYEDCGIYYIDYASNDTDLGGPAPIWLYPEECELLDAVIEDILSDDEDETETETEKPKVAVKFDEGKDSLTSLLDELLGNYINDK